MRPTKNIQYCSVIHAATKALGKIIHVVIRIPSGLLSPEEVQVSFCDGKQPPHRRLSTRPLSDIGCLARVHEHNKELREREVEEARIEEAARRLEYARLADEIQRGE